MPPSSPPAIADMFSASANPVSTDPGSIALREALNTLKAGRPLDRESLKTLSPAQQTLARDYAAICEAGQKGTVLSSSQIGNPEMRKWVEQQPGGKISSFDADVSAYNIAYQQVNAIPKAPAAAPAPAPVATPPISQPQTAQLFNQATGLQGRYKGEAFQFYQNPQGMAATLSIPSSNRQEFRTALTDAANGDFNATRRSINEINAGRAPSETPLRSEYRNFLADYSAAMKWTQGEMSNLPPGNRFSTSLGKANETRQIASQEFPKATAALQNWRMDQARQGKNGHMYADLNETTFQTQTQKSTLGDFKITAEYLLNAGAQPEKALENYLMNTQTSGPYNAIMRNYAKEYAALGDNPDPARIQLLQENHIDKARQQALQDLDAHGQDADRNAVIRDLKAAGQKEVGQINQTLQKQILEMFDGSPDTAPPAAPQYRTPQPNEMRLTN